MGIHLGLHLGFHLGFDLSFHEGFQYRPPSDRGWEPLLLSCRGRVTWSHRPLTRGCRVGKPECVAYRLEDLFWFHWSLVHAGKENLSTGAKRSTSRLTASGAGAAVSDEGMPEWRQVKARTNCAGFHVPVTSVQSRGYLPMMGDFAEQSIHRRRRYENRQERQVRQVRTRMPATKTRRRLAVH